MLNTKESFKLVIHTNTLIINGKQIQETLSDS